ncbi:MAG: hypothetical protein J4472_03515, partial [DPANN group archaeon]|nr:hypothetical protein [DPANN group archaeon]
GKRQVDSYTCPNGCVDGACVGASVPTGEVTYQGVLECDLIYADLEGDSGCISRGYDECVGRLHVMNYIYNNRSGNFVTLALPCDDPSKLKDETLSAYFERKIKEATLLSSVKFVDAYAQTFCCKIV